MKMEPKEPDEKGYTYWLSFSKYSRVPNSVSYNGRMIRARTRRHKKSFKQGLQLEKQPRKRKPVTAEEVLAQLAALDAKVAALKEQGLIK